MLVLLVNNTAKASNLIAHNPELETIIIIKALFKTERSISKVRKEDAGVNR